MKQRYLPFFGRSCTKIDKKMSFHADPLDHFHF